MRDALAKAACEAQVECGGRATAADKIHLTLFFIGSVDRSRVERMAECASSIAAPPFTLDLSTIGYWKHNRIVWAGTTDCPPPLASIVSALGSNLAAEGVRAEDRPYVPHITLVRDARRRASGVVLEAPPWLAREFVLVQSVGVPGGTRYEIVTRFPLVA